ncbi:5-hydroxymethyluracil DNA glycosylase [Aureimonas sp. Leaf454]|uniref:bifunctional DNA-formamidopyrimidine glycosylase/DNA-(apurinic or apyrimidinic site) lyase n=1 Tax=Aureimonas sp. Leaf454 TaxID=1736381 RepID=UPI0006FF183D|nr:bifunctional DNA-formamidopyrimidine glycosylase/DNA-(apurinic or apyrimidinic site) lyase [Aureimonas sp. Leaf454]KQT43144.1 5-hydroxymethyluracil DNA glycosylase [Aureimonas sp. Leaf454]
MPELPEVETVRRGLQPFAEGAVIARVELRRPDLRFPLPTDFAARLAGRRIESLDRRAKYLLARLGPAGAGEPAAGGEPGAGLILAMHLGMSGSFRVETDSSSVVPGVFHHPRSEAKTHDHVLFHLDTETWGPVVFVFNDPRRFGFMTLVEPSEIETHPHFRGLGIEPTGNRLDGEAMAALFANRSTPLKAALLDQRLVAGLGNIYVCEALWRARLSPRREAGSLVKRDGHATARLDALAIHIRETIAEAIEAGGSSLRDHRQADGTLGLFQHRFSVYDREDEPCPREGCRGIVKRIVQSGRSTFFCPVCQR